MMLQQVQTVFTRMKDRVAICWMYFLIIAMVLQAA